RSGNGARLIFTVDSFEGHVDFRAYQMDLTPRQVAAIHTKQIQEDLQALDIGVDLFLDPLSERWETDYRQSVSGTIDTLRLNNSIIMLREDFLYDSGASRFLVGPWLLGRCPNCGSDAGGYACETCGQHFRPDELLDKRPRVETGPLRT